MTSILIGLITCKRDVAWLQACKDTWLRDVPREVEVVTVDETFLPPAVPDTYDALPLKTKALAGYGRALGYDSVVKCDVDTYVRPKMLVTAINALAHTVEYAGRLRGRSSREYVPCQVCYIPEPEHAKANHPFHSVPNDCDYCSGGLYVLRKRAIQVMAEATLTRDLAEDRWCGNTLNGFGIKPFYMTGIIAPTHTPVSDYLKSANTIACMQMEEPQMMRDVHAGKFVVKHASGSKPEDYPVGHPMREQMHNPWERRGYH